jgi:dipeptidyl-peptidase-4
MRRCPAWLGLFALSACVGSAGRPAPLGPAAPPLGQSHETPPATHGKAITGGTPVAPSKAETEADAAFLREYVATRGWTLGGPVQPRFTADGKTVVFLRSGARDPRLSLYAFDVALGQTRELASAEKLLGGGEEKLGKEEAARRERMRTAKLAGFTSFEIARDGQHVLATLSGRVYWIAVEGGAATELAGPDGKGGSPFDARLSSDGTRVGFVRGDELWVAPTSGKGAAVQVTRGAGGDIDHAQAEFVAQEELDRFTGWWFSPDASQVVYQESDAAGVEKIFLADPVDPFDPITPAAYPRPGKTNVAVRLGITATQANGKTTWIDWDRKKYPYVARVAWAENAPLTVMVLSRDQRDLSLLAVDAKTGKSRELVHEHDDVFLNVPEIYDWLRDGSAFLWASERGGAWQLELHTPDGKLVRTLTKPELGLAKLAWVDPKKEYVIVSAAAETVDHELYKVALAGGDAERISEPGVATGASYARDVPARIVERASEREAYPREVYRADGTKAGTLPDESEKPPLEAKVQIKKVGTRGLWTSLVRPSQFDPSKKYPVLVNVYGGPARLTVHRVRAAYLLSQWVADHGYIVVTVDNRGTPGRGRDWERAIYQKFAEIPLADQVDGLKALASTEPSMDLARVGIWGASFGGYMAALAVLRRPDVYKSAIAISLVSDWLDYDTVYTERYLGVPDGKDTSTYDSNGLLEYADNLSRPLLIVHGTADDNVHFSHALALADALLRAGKPFDFLPLARQTHGPRDPKLLARYYERIFGFFRETL